MWRTLIDDGAFPMKLYFASDTCSFSPHIVLQELEMPYDLVRVNNRTKRTSEGGDFLAVNPKGYVAALSLDNGDVLTEGAVIGQAVVVTVTLSLVLHSVTTPVGIRLVTRARPPARN